MKLAVVLKTTEFCGDHSRDAEIACELLDAETVEQLAERLLEPNRVDGYRNPFADRLEIRLVRESKPPKKLEPVDPDSVPF
jgi:hypothetical protein